MIFHDLWFFLNGGKSIYLLSNVAETPQCSIHPQSGKRKKELKKKRKRSVSYEMNCATLCVFLLYNLTNDCDLAVCLPLLVVMVARCLKSSFPSCHLCLSLVLLILLHLRLYFNCSECGENKEVVACLKPFRHWELSACQFWLGVERKPNRTVKWPRHICIYSMCVYI